MNTEDLFKLYNAGGAITAGLAAIYERDGIDYAGRILTADEFAAVSAFASTLPSTAMNNVWD